MNFTHRVSVVHSVQRDCWRSQRCPEKCKEKEEIKATAKKQLKSWIIFFFVIRSLEFSTSPKPQPTQKTWTFSKKDSKTVKHNDKILISFWKQIKTFCY